MEQYSPSRLCAGQSAIYLGKDEMYHELTKRIRVLYIYVREVFGDGVVV